MNLEQTKVHTYSITILESHLDTLGHVNNAMYLTLLEEARWDISTSLGFGLEEIQKSQIGPIILDIHIQFKKEIRLRQNVIIETKFEEISKRIATIHHVIRDEQGTVYCLAKLKFGFFDMQSRKLILPPEKWLKAMGIG